MGVSFHGYAGEYKGAPGRHLHGLPFPVPEDMSAPRYSNK